MIKIEGKRMEDAQLMSNLDCCKKHQISQKPIKLSFLRESLKSNVPIDSPLNTI